MADIILDRQRDYPANVAIFPVAFIFCKQYGTNYFFSHSFSVLFNFPLPRTKLSVLNIFSTSVTCKFLDLIRKWHHNPDDSTDIIFRLILSVFPFSLISRSVIHHQLWRLFFCCLVAGPDDLFSIYLDFLVYTFVGEHLFFLLSYL